MTDKAPLRTSTKTRSRETIHFLFSGLTPFIFLFFFTDEIGMAQTSVVTPQILIQTPKTETRLSDDEWVGSLLRGDFQMGVGAEAMPVLKVCLKLDDQQIAEIQKLAKLDELSKQLGQAQAKHDTEPNRPWSVDWSKLPKGEPLNRGVNVRKLLGNKDEDFREWVGEQSFIRWNVMFNKSTDIKTVVDQVDQKFKTRKWTSAFENKRSIKTDPITHEKLFHLRIEYEVVYLQQEDFADIPAHHTALVGLHKSKAYKDRQIKLQALLDEMKEVMNQY